MKSKIEKPIQQRHKGHIPNTRVWRNGFGITYVQVNKNAAVPLIGARKALQNFFAELGEDVADFVWKNPIRETEKDTDTMICYREGETRFF